MKLLSRMFMNNRKFNFEKTEKTKFFVWQNGNKNFLEGRIFFFCVIFINGNDLKEN